MRADPCIAGSSSFSLLRLSHAQTIDIAESRVPEALQVSVAEDSLPPDFIGRTALEQRSAGKSAYWCAAFLIVRDADQLVVGSCCFKDEPRNGRVEIGYGISPAYRRQGAATDTVLALLKLAIDGGAKEVLAEVSPENFASTGLVRKLGFADAGSRVDDDNESVVQWVASVAGQPFRDRPEEHIP
jgi:RimJ/RimL family protein N-acetyltransferase